MIDAREVEARTGWRVRAHEVLASTNDEAARLRDAGATHRVVVVADCQTAGRGRDGRAFVSPEGGLYASMLLRVPAADLPQAVVGAVAIAVAEACEAAAGVRAWVKWPNDVWIEGKKVAGLLAETTGGPDADGQQVVVMGVGVNLAGVPAGLPSAVAAETTAIALHASAPVSREALLADILPRVDGRLADLRSPSRRAALGAEYRRRLTLLGGRVRFLVGATERRGVLRDADLHRGLLVEGEAGVPVWVSAALVHDLRPG